jgi:hypothetical protein
MKNFDPTYLIQREGLGNINYQGTLPNGGINFTGANNGVSLSTITPGTVVLGQNVGQVGAPAQLLSIREIPLNGFSILYSGMANGPAGALIFQYGAAAINSTEPQIVMRNHLGTQIGALRIGESNDSVYLGNNAAPGNTGIINVMVGGGAGNSQLTMSRCIGIGGGALQGNADGLTNIIAIGNDTLDNNGFAVGTGAIVIGQNAFDIGAATIGINLLAIGTNNNTSVGTAVGANVTIYGHNVQVGGGLTNTTILGSIGNGANLVTTSNIIILGTNTQNTILGQNPAGAFTDNGNRLQVLGKLNTGGAAPLTLSFGNMDFGKIVTAASVLNATKYWEVSVDGVLVKVCIN